MRIILTNLFTTLQCQRKTISDNPNFSFAAFQKYGKTAIVKLLEFKRPEKKFTDLEELKQQMIKDINDGREF